MASDYSLQTLYRLPYTASDSPSMIIEPTADCNLRCPGCYRRSGYLNRDSMTFEEGVEYIDEALRIRNMSQILFSGGEPLMYPELDGLIEHARGRGLKVKINTNGVLLDRDRLRRFADLGVEGVQIHVDRHQGREKTEAEVARTRERFCAMFREVGGPRLGFHGIVHPDDLEDTRAMARFYAENSDVVTEINFAAFCQMPKKMDLPSGVPADYPLIVQLKESYFQVYRMVQGAFGFECGAYLGSQFEPDRPGKMYALLFYRDGRLLASATAEQFREAHEAYYREHGSYGYGSEMFGTFKKVAGLDEPDVHVQYIRISFPPLPVGKAMNLCDSCVDPVLYEGRLIPMCVLEFVRNRDQVEIAITR